MVESQGSPDNMDYDIIESEAILNSTFNHYTFYDPKTAGILINADTHRKYAK